MNAARRIVISLLITCIASLMAGHGVHAQSPHQEKLRKSIKDSGATILNNFCWDLVKSELKASGGEEKFSLPIDRWVYIAVNSATTDDITVELILDDGKPLPIKPYGENLESMQYLKAGTHTLKYSTTGNIADRSLIIRAMPAIQHGFYGADYCHVSSFGLYKWEFLEKYINPNVNVMIDLGLVKPDQAHIDEWTAMGRQWITHVKALFDIDRARDGEEQRLLKYWESQLGVSGRYSQGILIDELGEHNATYDLYLKVAQRMYDGSMKGRIINTYAYGNDLADDPAGQAFGNWLAQHGGEIAVEWYLMDTPDLKSAKETIQVELIDGVKRWTTAFPADRLIATLCSCNIPCENADRYPQTDMKVYLDMQMHAMANDPAAFGIGGVQMYYSSYSDEEIQRWISKLYRHYCIEGSKDRFTDDPYELPHLNNGDFSEGDSGWKIEPAVQGSIAVKSFEGLGVLQSRWGGSPNGDNFIWMKRNGSKPNKIVQTIKGLTPGRYYSLKMISSDYSDLINTVAANKSPTVIATIDGVELSQVPNESFVQAYPHSFGRTQGDFSPTHQYWNQFHWQVFRATAPTATLTISDWRNVAEDSFPMGAAGQESVVGYISVQPFLEK